MATIKLREKQIESYLRTEIRKHDGHAYKFTSPEHRGVPDRICVLPCFTPNVFFVEVKSETGNLSSAQLREHDRIRKAKGEVYLLSSKDDVDLMLDFGCEGTCSVGRT